MRKFSKTQKLFLNFFIILTLFLCGVCFHSTEADSFLSYETERKTTPVFNQIQMSNTSDICTAEMLGQHNDSHTLSFTKRLSNKTLIKYFFLFTYTVSFSEFFSYFTFRYATVLFQELSSHKTIISYIHNKDGKKAPFVLP